MSYPDVGPLSFFAVDKSKQGRNQKKISHQGKEHRETADNTEADTADHRTHRKDKKTAAEHHAGDKQCPAGTEQGFTDCCFHIPCFFKGPAEMVEEMDGVVHHDT